MVFRVITLLLAAVVAAALAVLTWPEILGVQDTYPIAQILAFRMIMIFAVSVPVLFFLVLLIFRRTRFFAVTFLVVFLAFAFANSLILNARGWGLSNSNTAGVSTSTPDASGAPATTTPVAPAPAAIDPAVGPTTITVLEWNVRGGSVKAETIANLALSAGAQVITLPEGYGDQAKEIAARMADGGDPMSYFTANTPAAVGQNATTLLISQAFGEYKVSTAFGDTKTAPSVVAEPVNGIGPSFAAVHPVSPSKPEQMAAWSSDLRWITDLCNNKDFVIGGDFNATLDHLTNLDRCQDAARTTASAAVGTWPTSLPPFLSAPIDHIMSTTSWRATAMQIVETQDGAGSDHRPIIATLQRVG